MIDFIPIKRLYSDIGEQYFDLLHDLYSNHDKHFENVYTKKCEDILKNICNRKHAFLTTSGTSSITIMLLAAGVKAGDKVITTTYSCPATVMPIKVQGAEPIFYDINKFGSQDISDIKHDAKAIIVTGLYGDSCDYDQLDHSMVLNDSAQCFGGYYKEIPSPKFGDMSILSFSTNKNCPIFGTYGAVLTDNDELADKIFLIRRNGYRNRDVGNEITEVGINAQPHEDKALQLFCSLQHFEKWQTRRKAIAEYYKSELDKLEVAYRPSPNYSKTNNHKFCIFVDNKKNFRDKMEFEQVECQQHYTYNFSKVDILSSDTSQNFKFTESYVKHAISIPSSPWMSDAECEHVIQSVKKCITAKDKGVLL